MLFYWAKGKTSNKVSSGKTNVWVNCDPLVHSITSIFHSTSRGPNFTVNKTTIVKLFMTHCISYVHQLCTFV